MSSFEEGMAILQACAEQSHEMQNVHFMLNSDLKKSCCFVCVFEDHKYIDVYIVTNLTKFANDHQKALDENSELNGFQAAVSVMNQNKMKLCSFMLD